MASALSLPKKLKLKFAKTGECRRCPPPLNYVNLVSIAVKHWGDNPYVFQFKDECGDRITVDSLTEYVDALTIVRDLGEPVITLSCFTSYEELVSSLTTPSLSLPHSSSASEFLQQDYSQELRFDGDEVFTRQQFFEEYGNYDRWLLAKTFHPNGQIKTTDLTATDAVAESAKNNSEESIKQVHFNEMLYQYDSDDTSCSEVIARYYERQLKEKEIPFGTKKEGDKTDVDAVVVAAAAAAAALEQESPKKNDWEKTSDRSSPSSAFETEKEKEEEEEEEEKIVATDSKFPVKVTIGDETAKQSLSFEPSAKWVGPRKGAYFGNGNMGQGYYPDELLLSDKEAMSVKQGKTNNNSNQINSPFVNAMDAHNSFSRHKTNTARFATIAEVSSPLKVLPKEFGERIGDGRCWARTKRNRRCRTKGVNPAAPREPFYCETHKSQQSSSNSKEHYYPFRRYNGYSLPTATVAKEEEEEGAAQGDYLMISDVIAQEVDNECIYDGVETVEGRRRLEEDEDQSEASPNSFSEEDCLNQPSTHSSFEEFHDSFHKFRRERLELVSMGFNDEDMNMALLVSYEGRVDKVVDHYLSAV